MQGFIHTVVAALGVLSWALCSLGYPDKALTRVRESLALARTLSHPMSETFALGFLAVLHMQRREFKACLETAEAVIALSSEQGFAYYLAWGAWLRAAALAEEGELQEGISGMCSVLEAMRATGAVAGSSGFLALLAGAHGKAGQVEEGLAVVAKGLEFVTKTSERYAEAELHRAKAELLLARTPADPARAEASFGDALEVARHQSAKFWELRAATGLARLWQQQGRKRHQKPDDRQRRRYEGRLGRERFREPARPRPAFSTSGKSAGICSAFFSAAASSFRTVSSSSGIKASILPEGVLSTAMGLSASAFPTQSPWGLSRVA